MRHQKNIMALMPLVLKLSNILLSKMSRIEIDNKQLIILNKDKINFKYFSFIVQVISYKFRYCSPLF